ncbi:hypothetical protein AB751O23_AQ_00040 [Chlamydiales bacterium SCGC AB-751-O23]|nr:hypothetical protein AB751O23_AQ_00040 [Chlamydiales bacterium SCGC AB-751-O23]
MSTKAIPFKPPSSLSWYTSSKRTLQKNKKILLLGCIAVIVGASLAYIRKKVNSDHQNQPRDLSSPFKPVKVPPSANRTNVPSLVPKALRIRPSTDPVPLTDREQERLLNILAISQAPSSPLVHKIPDSLPALQRNTGNRAYAIDSVPPVTEDTPGYLTLLQNHNGSSRHLLEAPQNLFSSQIDFFKAITGNLNPPTTAGRKLLDSLKSERTKNLSRIPVGQKPLEILIVGQGIGGLFAALEAYKSGANIIRVEAREEMKRDQILRLDISSRKYLKDNCGFLFDIANTWDLIKEERTNIDTDILSANFYTIETKNLELIVDSILNALGGEDSSTIRSFLGSFQSFSPPKKEGGKWNSELLLKSGEIEGPVSLEVDYIVGSDGANSRVREVSEIAWAPISDTSNSGVVTFPNLFSQNLSSEHFFSVPQILLDGAQHNLEEPVTLHACRSSIGSTRLHEQVIDNPSKKTDFGTVESSFYSTASREQVRIKTVELDLVRRGLAPYLKALRGLTWELNRTPINRLFISAHTIYLGTDVPAETFEEMQRENRSPINERPIQMRYFRKVLESNFPRYLIDFLMPYAKNSFVFKSQLFKANQSYKQIVAQKAPPLEVFLLGDANSTPQFQTGSGGFKALSDARDFGELLKKNLECPRAKLSFRAEYLNKINSRSTSFAQKAFDLGVLSENPTL